MGLELYRAMMRLRLIYGKRVPDGWYVVEYNDDNIEVRIRKNKIVDIAQEQ